MSASSSLSAPHRRRSSLNQDSTASQLSLSSRLLHWLGKRLGRSIRVRGHGLGTRLSLDKKPDAPKQPQYPGMVVLKPVPSERQKAMRKELHELLHKHPQTVSMHRHLAYVERTLRHKGAPAVDALPVDVLKKALTQLESLVKMWSLSALDEVRSRLTLLIKNKEIIARNLGEPQPQPLDIKESGPADVSEVSHSVFEEMDRSWRGRLPESVSSSISAASPNSGPSEVSEASHSLFEEMERSWHGRAPQSISGSVSSASQNH